ncbi:MAG: FHA domain-containing protein [Verrucomicrobia bacterium]|nr:FHA domain-containing protein [Verrucomicrobiota bacterium]MBI3869557.1 FHA domain-containing protein [Verrucomicrobiota bacterium]
MNVCAATAKINPGSPIHWPLAARRFSSPAATHSQPSLSMPKLHFQGPVLPGKTYELLLEKTTIGRGEENVVSIPDPELSHAHCEFLTYGAEVIVRDIGSRNGTFVNDRPLHNQQTPLRSGDKVRFGSIEVVVEIEPEGFTEDATEMSAIHAMGNILREIHERPRQTAQPGLVVESTEPAPSEETVPMLPHRAPTPNNPTQPT